MSKAIQIDRYGALTSLCDGTCRCLEVLIRLAWSGINSMDIHTRQGKYAASRTYPQKLPTTLGIEGAGTVEALGDRVTDFARGDRVA